MIPKKNDILKEDTKDWGNGTGDQRGRYGGKIRRRKREIDKEGEKKKR